MKNIKQMVFNTADSCYHKIAIISRGSWELEDLY